MSSRPIKNRFDQGSPQEILVRFVVLKFTVARVFADRTNHHAESCRCGSLHLPSSSGDRASKIARPLDVGIDSHLENRHRRIFTRFLPASHPKKAATRQT